MMWTHDRSIRRWALVSLTFAVAFSDRALLAQRATENTAPPAEEVNLLDAARSGRIRVHAEGTGDGRMTVSITNRSPRTLNVVLPPGLVAVGASGQFGGGMGGMGGGMGGMGGGMGGMGGMGGGMGGMGGGMGGMGGMGGGMGGMGGGMGGMGGRGGMGGGGTMPASMGMMQLSMIIMNLIGERDSWDTRSMMMGGGMGGMGGGMMGGMGGMGGGMMGGMGGGMRSVPPTGPRFAALTPGQTRHLPTTLISLQAPDEGQAKPTMPAKGESLLLDDVGRVSDDRRVQAALRGLTAEKAPQSISQLVMWNVADGLGWETIGQLANGWANPHEVALARNYVERLGQNTTAKSATAIDPGTITLEVTASEGGEELATILRKLLADQRFLGLKVVEHVPSVPTAPGLAIRLQINEGGKAARAGLGVTTPDAGAWQSLGTIKLTLEDQTQVEKAAAKLADRLAADVLARLVRVKLHKGPRVKGKETYTVRIENGSPLILNGLALSGSDSASPPSALSGLTVPPHKSVTVPASAEVVERFGWKTALTPAAADFSAL